MSDQIKLGDLVMRIKPEPCGCFSENIGQIFTVKNMLYAAECFAPVCIKCDSDVSKSLVVALQDKDVSASTGCLKKIPPLNELEETKTTDEVPA